MRTMGESESEQDSRSSRRHRLLGGKCEMFAIHSIRLSVPSGRPSVRLPFLWRLLRRRPFPEIYDDLIGHKDRLTDGRTDGLNSSQLWEVSQFHMWPRERMRERKEISDREERK